MRLVYLLILLSLATQLLAQTKQKPENWLGLNNLFFKHKDVITDRLLNPGDSSTFLFNEIIDHQFSFGLSFRKVKEDGSRYQQFDLAIDKKHEEFKLDNKHTNTLHFRTSSGLSSRGF